MKLELKDVLNPYVTGSDFFVAFDEGAARQITADQVEVDRLEEAHKAEIAKICAVYDEYVALLVQEEESLLPLAFSHGVRVDPKDIKRGKELRAEIARLKSGEPLNEKGE